MSASLSPLRSLGNGRFATVIDGNWSLSQRVNGGYLQRVAATAALEVAQHPHPIAVTTDYPLETTAGSVELTVEPLRLGNSLDYLRVTMWQHDLVVSVSSLVIGELDGKPADMDMSVSVDVPSPDRCTRIERDTFRGRNLPMMDLVEVRLAPECLPLLQGKGDGSFASRGWVRFIDDQELDPLGCITLAHAFPPVSFTLGRHGCPPTVQLSTYLRSLPVQGWLRGEVRGRVLNSGWFDQESTLRDTAGNVIAQTHQLVLLPD